MLRGYGRERGFWGFDYDRDERQISRAYKLTAQCEAEYEESRFGG